MAQINASMRGTSGRHGAVPSGTLAMLWRTFCRDAFDPYRPELHYMRGPGPKWRAKHGLPAATAPAAPAPARPATA